MVTNNKQNRQKKAIDIPYKLCVQPSVQLSGYTTVRHLCVCVSLCVVYGWIGLTEWMNRFLCNDFELLVKHNARDATNAMTTMMANGVGLLVGGALVIWKTRGNNKTKGSGLCCILNANVIYSYRYTSQYKRYIHILRRYLMFVHQRISQHKVDEME